jgi:TolB-like protein/DNA-binding winged helix-turn-helix (wHTH) protein/Tfp pilus assembly protein PilF
VEGDFKIGEWLVSPALNQISNDGKSARVEPKAMQVLVQLAGAEGVVNKDRLISTVWPDVFVTDDVLPGCIASLRRAFDDNARKPKIIETIPKSGYRLLLPVEPCNGNGQRSEAAKEPAAGVRASDQARRRWWLAGAVAGGLLILVLAGWRFAFPAGYDSVAILPFINAAGDSDAQYLSDGVPESVIDDLSQTHAVRVMAWTSVSHYRSAQPDIRTLGRQLGVSAVLTGRLVREGDRLILQTELVDAGSGRQLWGKQYDSRINDLLGVQQQLAREIAANLRVRLTGAEEKKLAGHTASPVAYQLYLKGRLFWNQRNRDALLKAIDYFEQAIKADPNYALAYAGLADSYDLLDDWGKTPPRDSFPKARAAAEKALELDDSLAEAHTSLAQVHESYEWNWAEAEREYKRAIELNPNYPTAHQWYAMFLGTHHRFREAEAEARRASELDPLSPPIAMTVAEIFEYERRYDDAIAQYKKVLELSPSFAGAWGNLGSVYEEKQAYPDAIEAWKKESVLLGNPEIGLMLERAYRKGGHQAVVKASLEEDLQKRAQGKYCSALSIAGSYAMLGDVDQAVKWIEKGYEEHSSSIPYITVRSEFDGIRGDPRFQYWVEVLGLEQSEARTNSRSE